MSSTKSVVPSVIKLDLSVYLRKLAMNIIHIFNVKLRVLLNYEGYRRLDQEFKTMIALDSVTIL